STSSVLPALRSSTLSWQEAASTLRLTTLPTAYPPALALSPRSVSLRAPAPSSSAPAKKPPLSMNSNADSPSSRLANKVQLYTVPANQDTKGKPIEARSLDLPPVPSTPHRLLRWRPPACISRPSAVGHFYGPD